MRLSGSPRTRRGRPVSSPRSRSTAGARRPATPRHRPRPATLAATPQPAPSIRSELAWSASTDNGRPSPATTSTATAPWPPASRRHVMTYTDTQPTTATRRATTSAPGTAPATPSGNSNTVTRTGTTPDTTAPTVPGTLDPTPSRPHGQIQPEPGVPPPTPVAAIGRLRRLPQRHPGDAPWPPGRPHVHRHPGDHGDRLLLTSRPVTAPATSPPTSNTVTRHGYRRPDRHHGADRARHADAQVTSGTSIRPELAGRLDRHRWQRSGRLRRLPQRQPRRHRLGHRARRRPTPNRRRPPSSYYVRARDGAGNLSGQQQHGDPRTGTQPPGCTNVAAGKPVDGDRHPRSPSCPPTPTTASVDDVLGGLGDVPGKT